MGMVRAAFDEGLTPSQAIVEAIESLLASRPRHHGTGTRLPRGRCSTRSCCMVAVGSSRAARSAVIVFTFTWKRNIAGSFPHWISPGNSCVISLQPLRSDVTFRPMPKPVRHCEGRNCGRLLPPTMRADARFCSPKCRASRHRYENQGRPLWISKNALFGGVDRYCAHCHGPLASLYLDDRRADAVYCSTKCRVTALPCVTDVRQAVSFFYRRIETAAGAFPVPAAI